LQSGLSPGHQLYNTLVAEQGILRKEIVPTEGQDQLAGELVASSDGSRAVIRVSSLPQLEADKTFQLWFIGAGGIESGGLFKAEVNSDSTYILVPLEDDRVENYEAFAVSIEPEGGSPDPNAPTTPPIFAVPMTT
jgi:anti-sigma-K factor RskA